MRKIMLIFVVSCLSLAAKSQTWVEFTQPDPQPADIQVTTSSAQEVQFTIEVAGMYKQAVQHDGETYQRLQIPGANVSKTEGEPELPYIAKYVAIPECTDVQLNTTTTGTNTLSNYTVYPAPAYQEVNNPDGTVHMEEVFSKSPTAYADNKYVTGTDAEIVSIGYLRDQKYALVHVYPVQFNPVTEQLKVNPNFTLTLQFANATTDVNVNTGIFNNVATHTLINYQNGDMKATVNDNVERNGNVQWVTLTSPADADNIAADYLIICADPFFEPNNPDSEVLRIANHRAQYNGFDIAIVNYQNIYEKFYDFNNIPYEKERSIRDFTKAVYEGSNAQHIYDGKLGYVLLIGDVDAGNTGMPTSYDHTYSAANNTSDITPSDYYFTCVTEEDGGYDEIGDLFIGRFSVDNNASGATGLHNIIEKTIKNETEFSPNWKNNVHAYNGTFPNNEYYADHYHPYVDFITQSQDYDFVNYFAYSNNTDRQNAFKQMTDNGAATLIYSGHGGVETWEGAINNTYITNNLNNTLKSPFAASLACLTGYFDHSTQKCMGEKLTTYSPDKGFVGFLGAGRVTWGSASYPIHYPPFIPYKLQTSIPYSIYYDLSFITGEFILESKVRSNSLHKFGYNYFGDPALNIMAQGYEITQDLTLNSSTDISSDITVKNNSMVAFNNNLSLHNGANFIIESGSSVELSSNTFVSAEPQSMFTVEGTLRLTNQQLENLTVEVKNGGKLIIDDAVTFHANTNLIVQQGGVIEAANGSSELIICGNVSLSSGVKIANFTQNNTGGIIYKGTGAFDMVQSDIQNTRITAFFRNGRPQIEDCNFTNSPLYLIGGETNSCSIENNRFSGAEGAAALKVEGFPTYTISNNVFSNNESHAISLYNAGSTTYRQYVISNNIIHHNSDLRSAKGIVLYASVADIRDNVIYSNDFGLGLYHNSSVRMWGDPEKASQQVYGNKYNLS